MKLWKVLGLAGVAGVAATGAIIARNERRRAQLTPEEVRARLQQRLDEAQQRPEPADEPFTASPGLERRGCLSWPRRAAGRRQARA
jgi:hypothetical protein